MIYHFDYINEPTWPAPSATQTTADPFVSIKYLRCLKTP